MPIRADAPPLLVLAAALALLTACTGDGRAVPDSRVPLPPTTTLPPTAATDPAATAITLPPLLVPPSGAASTIPAPDPVPATEPVEGAIVVDRLWSPEPAIAQMSGTGATSDDAVTVDGAPADVVAFERRDDGGFDLRVFVADEGAHTVCVADACGRVYTFAPDAETTEEVVAKIDQATTEAFALVPFDEWFPDWTIEVGGLMAGTGGSVDAETRTVIVHRNRGRTIDDFVRTVFHEYGHVADIEWLDDARRAEFAALRGFDPAQPWRTDGSHRVDDWAASPSEDFAETIAALWSGDRWPIRTDGGALDADARALLDAVIADGLAG